MRRHKRLILWSTSVLIAATPILSPLTSRPEILMTATAEENDIPFEYNNCGDHIEITRYTSTKYVMEIPTEIEGLPVTKIAAGAFKGDPDVAYVFIPETIEEIGDSAFEGCWQLTTVDFASQDGLRKIGNYAFFHCPNIESIILPDSVTEIGACAFAGCGVRHAVLPASLRILRQEVFADDTQLDTVMLPEGIERIEENAFKACDSLHRVCYKGSANDWAVLSIGCGNDTLRNAECICEYNQPKVERPYTFNPKRDSWSFTNGDVGYYVLSDETFAELTAGMSHTEQAAAETYWGWAKEQYAGCCAGMADLSLLAAAGILDPALLDPDAECLHDVALTDAVRELLTYYLVMENSGSTYEDDVFNSIEIYDCLAKGIPLLFCYYMAYPTGNADNPYTIAGHAVVAYGMEEGRYEFDGTVYQKKILTYDSNLPEDRREEGYVYADPDADVKRCPLYVPYWAEKGAQEMYLQTVRRSLDAINLHGVNTGNAYEEPAQIHPLLRSIEFPAAYTVQTFAPEHPDENTAADYQTGVTGMSQALSFQDAANGYAITWEEAQAIDCTMSYEHLWYAVEGSQLTNAAFAPDGSVSVKGTDTDISLTLVADEGCHATSFYKLTLSGEHASELSLTKSDNGYLISGSGLQEIELNATSRNAWVSLTFSTDAEQILLTETKPHTLSVLADTDGDGKFETMLVDRAADSLGDVNADRTVNASDAAQVLIAAANVGAGSTSGLTEAQETAADVNADGVCNATDAAWILQYAALAGSGVDVTMRAFMMQ